MLKSFSDSFLTLCKKRVLIVKKELLAVEKQKLTAGIESVLAHTVAAAVCKFGTSDSKAVCAGGVDNDNSTHTHTTAKDRGSKQQSK